MFRIGVNHYLKNDKINITSKRTSQLFVFRENYLGNDTITFAGKEKKTLPIIENKTKSIVVAVAGLLGIKKASNSVQNIQEVLPEKEFVISLEDNKSESKLRNILSKMTVKGSNQPLYSKEAIDMIMNYNEEDAYFAYKLAKVLSDSSDLSVSASLECIAKNLKEHPQRVEKFLKLDAKPSNYVSYLFAAEEDLDLTNELIEYNSSRNEAEVLKPVDFYILVCLLSKNYSPKVIKHYAKEDRVVFGVGEIEYLCERDIHFRKEIEELLTYIEENKGFIKPWDSTRFKPSFVPEVIETFALYPKEVKKLMKNGVLDANHINNLAEPYSIAPRELEDLLRKSQYQAEETGRPIDFDFIKDYSVKVKDLSLLIEKLFGKTYYNIPLKDLKSFVDEIENNWSAINRIIIDGREKDYKKLIPVYNKYPNEKITEKMIAKETDFLAKYFNF